MPKAAFVIAKGSARWLEKPQAAGGRLSHLPGRFPGRYKKDSSRKFLPFESPLYGGVRPYRGNGFPDDPVRVRPKQLIHSDLLTVPE